MDTKIVNNREMRLKINWDASQLINEYGIVLADLDISYITPFPIGYQFKHNGYVVQLFVPESKTKILATKCLIAGSAQTTVAMDYRYVGGDSW